MADKNSVITSLRTIRIAIDAIHKRTYGHDYRNRLLSVMRREMAVIVETHREFRGDHYLRDKTDLREQLADGLRALTTLLHDGGDAGWDQDAEQRRDFETHREVNARLTLVHDLATFLIRRAEEELPPTDEEKYPQDETGLDASLTVTTHNSTLTISIQPDVWETALDEIDAPEEAPDDPSADDLAL